MKSRVLYTGDCTYLFQDQFYSAGGKKYDSKVFYDHVKLLADSGVDTVLVNPNGQRAWYPSKVFPTVLDHYDPADRSFFKAHGLNCDYVNPADLDSYIDSQVNFFQTLIDLRDQGIDWVEEMAKACREYRLTPWLSVRMNDMHGGGDKLGSYMNHPLFHDPAMRLTGNAPDPCDGFGQYWQGFNYERREVRDMMLTLICELVNDYDYEGLELDWLRNPLCCEPPASRKTQQMMLEWTAEVRELTQARAGTLGKPFLLGLRVPANLGMMKSLGLDVEAIVKEGLVDFVSPSNYWQTAWDVPHDEIRRRLGEKVTLYGVVEDGPNWVHACNPTTGQRSFRLLSASRELLRGNAAGKLALGADGIEAFNFFCTDSEVMRADLKSEGAAKYDELGRLSDLALLQGTEKHYAFSTPDGPSWHPLLELPEQLPIIIEPQSRRAFRLPMCAEGITEGLKLVIQMVLDGYGHDTPKLAISFNGSWPNISGEKTDRLLFPTGVFTHHVPEHRAYNFTFDVTEIRGGWNEITLYNNALFGEWIQTGRLAPLTDKPAHSVRVVSLELAVMTR